MKTSLFLLATAVMLPIAGCGGASSLTSSVTGMGTSAISAISNAMGSKQTAAPAQAPAPAADSSASPASLVSTIMSPSAPQDNSAMGKLKLVGGTISDTVTVLTLDERSEPELGESVGVSLTNTYPSPQIDPWTKYVAFVGKTVASTSPDQNIHYVFGVLHTDEVNACSGPGGYIFVTRGALKIMKDEAELAGVLGHEMAHVINHDGLSKAQAAAKQKLLVDGLNFYGKTAKVSKLIDIGVTAIIANPYSASQETDADKMAVHLMSAAGYTPTSYLNFIQRLATLQANGGGAFSTHPDAHNRAKAISDEISTVGSQGVTLQARFVVNIPPQ
jgi:predicted Zn-dependent protease